MEHTAELIRREIAKAVATARRCEWHPSTTAWHRAFGEISGMYRILQIVDPSPYDCDPQTLLKH